MQIDRKNISLIIPTFHNGFHTGRPTSFQIEFVSREVYSFLASFGTPPQVFVRSIGDCLY